MCQDHHVSGGGIEESERPTGAWWQNAAEPGRHATNGSFVSGQPLGVAATLLFGEPRAFGEDQDALIVPQTGCQFPDGLKFGCRVAGAAVDEVVGKPIAANVESRVDEKLPFQDIAEADPKWSSDERCGQHRVDHRCMSRQQEDGPTPCAVLTCHIELEREQTAQRCEVPPDPRTLEIECDPQLALEGDGSTQQQPDQCPDLAQKVDPEKSQRSHRHPRSMPGKGPDGVDATCDQSQHRGERGDREEGDDHRRNSDQSAGDGVVGHQRGLTLSFGADGHADAGYRQDHLISAIFFTWFAAACIWTINGLRRPVPPGSPFPPLWLPGMIVSELAPLYLVARAVIAAGFLAVGAGDLPIGRAGVVLFGLSELGLTVLMARTLRGAASTGHAPPWWSLVQLFERVPEGVQRTNEVPYWGELTLDVYARPDARSAPTLVYVHPGSWMRGRPGRQARAMFHRLADVGWVVLDIRYPLSPMATFPDHLVGVKRAISWAKEDGARFGVDPSRVAVSGGSSGAHLAALAALTSANVDLQPGFEEVDTSIVACIAFYGIYDLFLRHPTRYDWPFIAQHVLKTGRDVNPDLYELGSPIDQVHVGAPPFFVIHGEFDSIVLPAESQAFVTKLRDTGVDTTYFEVPGAQHGFDAIASMRTRAVATMCVEWLTKKVTLAGD